MNPKKKLAIWITALAFASLATVAAASAGGRGHCKHGGRHGGQPGLARLEHRVERLDLASDVRTKAFAIIDASRGEERALREKARAAHEELRAMLESGAPDTKQLDTQIDELGALKTRQHKQYLHTLLQVGALLPEDQRAQWFAPPHRGKKRNESTH